MNLGNLLFFIALLFMLSSAALTSKLLRNPNYPDKSDEKNEENLE